MQIITNYYFVYFDKYKEEFRENNPKITIDMTDFYDSDDSDSEEKEDDNNNNCKTSKNTSIVYNYNFKPLN